MQPHAASRPPPTEVHGGVHRPYRWFVGRLSRSAAARLTLPGSLGGPAGILCLHQLQAPSAVAIRIICQRQPPGHQQQRAHPTAWRAGGAADVSGANIEA